MCLLKSSYIHRFVIIGSNVILMKQKKSTKKYAIDPNIKEAVSNQNYIIDIRQSLRQALEQLQQIKLSSELQGQKRSIAEQQYQKVYQQNKQLKAQIDSLKKQLGRLEKKYSKVKQQKSCQKCKNDEQFREKIERQRQIYLRQRSILKNQINQLKRMIQGISNQNRQSRSSDKIQNFKNQIIYKQRTIDDQKKIIRYLDQKLSNFQLQKMQTLSYVDTIDQRFHELQMENYILKGIGKRQDFSPSRKNGSIKNLERLQKSREKLSKISPHY